MSLPLPKVAGEPALRMRLERLMHEAHISASQLAAHVGVTERSVYRWFALGSRPTRPLRPRIAAYLRLHGADPTRFLDPEAAMADVIDLPPGRPALHVAPPSGGATPSSTDNQEPPVETPPRNPLDDETLEHFGLTADPFLDGDDPDSIWMSPALARVEARLLATMKRREISVVYGGPGAGKSTLVRRVRARLAADTRAKVQVVSPASLNRAQLTSTALAVALIRDLVHEDTSSWPMEKRSQRLQEVLGDFETRGILPVMMIDEAHHLSNSALLAIKQVWDSYLLYRMLAVVLIGQQRLHDRLTHDAQLREVNGRTTFCEMPRLGMDTGAYLRWRCARVGADADRLFTADAIKAIGVRGSHPLWANNFACAALHKAREIGDTQVTAAHVGLV